jgi:hypothetical protein
LLRTELLRHRRARAGKCRRSQYGGNDMLSSNV